MKTIKLLFTAACALTLASCSNSITPETTEVGGNLLGCYKVEAKDYPLEGKDGRYTVTFDLERTDVSMPFTEETVSTFADPSDDSDFVAGFGIVLYDKNGEEIEKIPARKCDGKAEQQMKLFGLASGEKGKLSLRFECTEKPAKFRLVAQYDWLRTGPVVFDGSIGKYGVKNFEVDFNLKKGLAAGKYQYKTSPAGSFLYIRRGSILVDKESKKKNIFKFKLAECGNYDLITGDFNGTLSLKRDSETSPYYYEMEGTFTSMISSTDKSYSFTLKSKPLSEIDNVDKATYDMEPYGYEATEVYNFWDIW